VLELQQNLAVAISTDRKKDITIEQIDKVTLLVLNASSKSQRQCNAA